MCFFFNLNFLFLCFLFFVCPSIFLLFRLEIWSKSKLILNPILAFHLHILLYFPFVWFVLSSSFVSFSRSFLLFSFYFFNFAFCSAFLFLFPSWSSRCSNLAIPLAITFCWKRNPGRGIDPFWSQQEELNIKANRFSTLGHQVVLRLGKP